MLGCFYVMLTTLVIFSQNYDRLFDSIIHILDGFTEFPYFFVMNKKDFLK